MASSKRTSEKLNRPNVESARLDRIAGRVSSALRMSGGDPFREIVRLKIKSPPEDLFSLFPRIFRDRVYLDSVHGSAFPAKLSELFTKPALHKPADPLIEVIWAICRCLQCGDELCEFTQLREEYERSILLNSKSKAIEILDVIEDRFGHSVWLMQNRLVTAQYWDGIEETRKLAKAYEDECISNSLMQSILLFVSKRTEATGIKGHLKSDLLQFSERVKKPLLATYLRVKLFELPSIDTDDVPATLFYESQSCIIDYYETLIFVLQSAANFQAIPSKMLHLIEKPLAVIFKRTQDKRLVGIMRGIGIVPNTNHTYDEKRAEIIEAYTKGAYGDIVAKSDEYLNTSPDDMPIQVMRLKACMYGGIPLSYKKGILKDAFESLQKVLSASENTYSAAFEIITLSERFYGHSWAHYLTALVRYELRQEQSEFPSHHLRELFVKEFHLSPFSAVAADGKAKDQILNDAHLRTLFPYTCSVYNAVTTGKIDNDLLINEVRKRKYVAMYHLVFGKPDQAVEYFNWIIENTDGIENLRASGGAALAFLKLDKIDDAVKILVSAFVKNSNVAGILPVEQIVNSLKSPDSWPTSISLPLLFELYTSYFDGDSLTQLRYAFERFQQNHKINEPSDLCSLVSEVGMPIVVAYLKNVWTPEVMRQTILYSGTKEIEEARIKVCRLLTELDPANATNYLEEIKTRVKQQEIAKVTTLIEQSKVYVDVEAIRRSLKTKLGDSYARYKSSSQLITQKPGDLLYKAITQIVSKLADEQGVSVPYALSTYHMLLPDIGSESDVQFDALFSEVTNEFLRGDYGLNAYLSTTVRHGTLRNTLRKPVTDERLVTSRNESGSAYLRNNCWTQYYEGNVEHVGEWETILDALDAFTSEFDSTLDYIINDLIQIRITRGILDEGENENALFVYPSSKLERKYVQEQDQNLDNMDEFVNYCVDVLWEKTDRNLLVVQRVLNVEIRERLMLPFEKLTNSLNQINVPGVNELRNAVARARTKTQNQLGQVISWFKRSEVYDRQDYAADFPFLIALNMVRNTLSNASNWEGAEANLRQGSKLMPGRTLDGMVYVFHILLENAILRSGLEADKVNVNADISFFDGTFNARFVNNIASSIQTTEERNKLDQYRELLGSEESPRRAQGERHSGLHKIWLTLNSRMYKEPKLNFYHDKELSFVVELSFKLEGYEDERIDH